MAMSCVHPGGWFDLFSAHRAHPIEGMQTNLLDTRVRWTAASPPSQPAEERSGRVRAVCADAAGFTLLVEADDGKLYTVGSFLAQVERAPETGRAAGG